MNNLYDVQDVRPIIKNIFRYKQYNNYENANTVIKQLYSDYNILFNQNQN